MRRIIQNEDEIIDGLIKRGFLVSPSIASNTLSKSCRTQRWLFLWKEATMTTAHWRALKTAGSLCYN